MPKLQNFFFQIFLLKNLPALILIQSTMHDNDTFVLQSTMIMVLLCSRLFLHQHESQRLKMSNFILARESHRPCSSIGRATRRIMDNALDLESGQCGFVRVPSGNKIHVQVLSWPNILPFVQNIFVQSGNSKSPRICAFFTSLAFIFFHCKTLLSRQYGHFGRYDLFFYMMDYLDHYYGQL